MSRLTGEMLGTGAGLLIAVGAPEMAQANEIESRQSPDAQLGYVAMTTPFGNTSSLNAPRTLTPESRGAGSPYASLNNPNANVMDKLVRSCVLQEAANVDVDYGYMPDSLRKLQATVVTEALVSSDPDGDGPEKPVNCDTVIVVKEGYRFSLENRKGTMTSNSPAFSEGNLPKGASAEIVMDSPDDGDQTVTYENIPSSRAYTSEPGKGVRNVGFRIWKEIRNRATGAVEKVVVTRLRSSDTNEKGKPNGS